MTKESSVHVKLGYGESVDAKKKILLAEKGLLEIVRNIGTYSNLRKREYTLKNTLKKDLATLRTSIKNLKKDLPKGEELEIPGFEKPEPAPSEIAESAEKKRASKIRREKEQAENLEIEAELQDIEEKLNKLG